LVDVVVHRLFHFNDLSDFDDLINGFCDLNYLGDFDTLHYDLSDDFWNTNDLFLEEGDLNFAVNNFFNLLIHNNGFIDDLFNLLDAISVDNLLFNYFHLFDLDDLNLNLNDFLDDLWNLNNLFDSLDDGNWLLDNNLHNLGELDYVVDNFPGISVLNDFHCLLDNAIEWLDHFDNPLNNLLSNYFDLNNFPHYPFDRHDLFSDHFNFSNFGDSVVDDLLHNDRLFNFNYSLHYHLDFHYLWNFNDSLNDLLDDSGHLYNFL
jgi:hypothetical protein